MGKIEFSMENITKCLCTSCPVQGKSQCVKDKMKMMQEVMQEDMDSGMLIEPENVPGLYCATGKASCEDLYTHEICKCTECPIWKENDLASAEPMGYFCRDGKTR